MVIHIQQIGASDIKVPAAVTKASNFLVFMGVSTCGYFIFNSMVKLSICLLASINLDRNKFNKSEIQSP